MSLLLLAIHFLQQNLTLCSSPVVLVGVDGLLRTGVGVGRTAREIDHRRIRFDHIDENSVDPVESLHKRFERLPRADDRRVIRRPELPKRAIQPRPGLCDFLLQAGEDHRA